MALPEISLAQFNRIATGDYNAGLVDFKTDDHGNVMNELTKVNNRIHKKAENMVVLSFERILEVKETFVNALRDGGVSPAKLAEIREKLGIPDDLSASLNKDVRHAMMKRRFVPLTRQTVRDILDTYAAQGRGFTHASQRAVSLEDAEAAAATSNMKASYAKKRDEVNAVSLSAAKGRYAYEICDALSLLSTDRSLATLCKIVGNRFKGENAVNEKKAANTALKNQFTGLFQQALTLLDGNVNETGNFTFFGMKAKIAKGADGKLTIMLEEGSRQQKVSLGKTAYGFVNDLIGRAVVDIDTLGADNLKLMLDKVFSRDVEGFLTGEDRTSLTRSFASMILMKKTGSPEQRQQEYNALMNGDYNTGTLVEVANLALDGQVATKEDIDRLHAELVKNNAGLDDEMKNMLTRVAGLPFEKTMSDIGGVVYEFSVGQRVGNPIVADLRQVADATVPPAPPMPLHMYDKLLAPPEAVKTFIADLVFSDETMVSDVVVNMPGETMRNILADDKKFAAFAQLIQNPGIVDRAVAPALVATVKAGFAKMAEVLDAAWQKAHNNETLAQAMAKNDFVTNFAAFVRDKNQLPGRELAKFDSIIQNMANKGCGSIQTFINQVFNINADAVKNAQGGFTIEPYKDLTPEQIKAQLDKKNLNQILDDAATDSASPGQVALFKQVLSDYFVNMAKAADKRAAFAAALRYSQTFEFDGLTGDAFQNAKVKATAKFTGAILKGTSPLLQKMMQGLPRTVLGEFAEALDDMKSRLAPIPRKIVQAHLQKILDGSEGKIKSIALRKSLGAASVGEAFLCTFVYKDNGEEKKEDMVVKIMRHDAEEKVKREAEVFTAAAAKIGPGMLKTWQGQLAQYMTEFDFTNEARNVMEGVRLYDVEDNPTHPYRAIAPKVRSMKVSPLVPPSKNVMVCTLAAGETTDTFFTKMRENIQTSLEPVLERDEGTGRLKWDPQTKKPIFKKNVGASMLHNARIFCDHEYGRITETQKKLQQAASVWFSEALLGSGKFHGDAHAGNLMVTGQGEHVTFIDFGNLYELKTHYELDNQGNQVMETVQERNAEGQMVDVQRPKVLLDERVELLRLILGATLRDKAFFLQGFERLLSAEGKVALEANRAKAEAILDSVLAKGEFSFDVCYRLQGALSELQKLGMEMPPQINCFVQSMTRFQNTMAEMNTILNQTRAVIDLLKEGPKVEDILPPDPLDFIGEILHFSKTPEGAKLVDLENPMYDPAAPEGDPDRIQFWTVPAFVVKMQDLGAMNMQKNPLLNRNGEYQTKIRTSLQNAPDKVAEAKRICELFKRHLDTVLSAQLRRNLDDFAATFERNWNAAKSEEAQAAAIDTFAMSYATATRQEMSTQSNSYQSIYTGKYEAPPTFAKVVMGMLFNGAAAAQKMFDKNFSTLDKLNLGLDAKSIATKELGVSTASLAKTLLPSFMYSGPSADEIILSAISKDAEKMGGDKSYQIDIGV